MPLDTVQDLFIDQLRETYSVEKQLMKALPRYAKGVHTASLSEVFDVAHRQTRQHVVRLERVFALIGENARAKLSRAMECLVAEADATMRTEGADDVVDAGLVAAVQRIEHHEIAAYACLIRLAEAIGLDEAADLLQETLNEQHVADQRLSDVSESEVLSLAGPGSDVVDHSH